MALVLADRVLETTTTAGSGTITLVGAEPGYQSFSAVGDGNQTYYTITADTDWEVGIGTYTASGTTLSRDTVLSSSAGGAKVTFPAGIKKVFVTYPSEKSVNLDVSGNISLSSAVISGVAPPSAASDAANKQYVDSLAEFGITYHAPVKYEVPNSTGNLVATYNNGSSGVGATLTNADTLAAFVPDGVTASINDRVLIYSQTNGFENGVYVVSTVGNGSTSWVLTRASDADTYALKSPNSLGGGDAFYVTSGNTGAGETYLCNNSGVISFGSTAISFVQISAAQVYQAGTGISLTNTTISLVSPVAVNTGGTGTTTAPGNGELLIGNGSGYTLSTLTAGSGVSITNSAGSITLSATGLGGTVTAVTATGPLASSGGTTPDISIANSTGTGSVVLDQGATISSATITAAVSASITTITGTSANITTVTGTTAGFSSAAITQLSGTSAGITTVSGTTTTFSSGTITQFGATSATIATVSGTNVTYSNGNLTSATVTNVSGTNLSYGSATITTGNLTFSSTGQRITGDMSNATLASRLAFQTSTTNGNTTLNIIPNGTGTASQFVAHMGSDPANTSRAGINVNSSQSAALVFSDITGTGTYLPMTFYTGGSERMRLDTSGRELIGLTDAATVGGVNNSALQIFGGGAARINVMRGDANANSPAVFLSKSRSTSSGTFSALQSGDGCGAVSFYGDDGSSLVTNVARIEAFVDGAVSGSTVPGRLVFSTNPGSSTASATERMRIDSSGNVGIGTASPATKFQVYGDTNAAVQARVTNINAGASAASLFTFGNNTDAYVGYVGCVSSAGVAANGVYLGSRIASPVVISTDNAERMRIDSSGNVGIGTTAPTASSAGYSVLHINNATTGGQLHLTGGGSGAAATDGTLISHTNTELYVTNQENGPTIFFNNGSERARITATGNLLVGTSTDVSGRSGVISDVSGNVRAIPRTGSAKTSTYTLTVSDVGQFVEIGTGGGVDVPNGVFATGDAVSVFNNTTGNRTISLTITTAYIAGTDADKASVTLATRGVATILFISNSVCVVSGNVS